MASAFTISIEWAQDSEALIEGQGAERGVEDMQYLDGPEDVLLGGCGSCGLILLSSASTV